MHRCTYTYFNEMCMYMYIYTYECIYAGYLDENENDKSIHI